MKRGCALFSAEVSRTKVLSRPYPGPEGVSVRDVAALTVCVYTRVWCACIQEYTLVAQEHTFVHVRVPEVCT